MATEPMYACEIVLKGTETIAVTFSAGLSADLTGNDICTLTAGSYYTGDAAAGSFLDRIETDLNAAEVAAGNTATWTAQYNPTGFHLRVQLIRAGDTGDAVSTIVFSGIEGEKHLGFSEGNTLTAGVGELVVAAPNATASATYQVGYLWLPRVILTRDTRIPRALVATGKTPAGKAIVDGYGQHEIWDHQIEFVHAASVYKDKAADSTFAGNVKDPSGNTMATGDSNVPLETFWKNVRTEGQRATDQLAPVCKYLADIDDSFTVDAVDFVISDKEWLTDMSTVAEEINPSPLYYRVSIRGQESV